MALAAFPVQEQRLPVALASSNAMLQLLYLDLTTKRQVSLAKQASLLQHLRQKLGRVNHPDELTTLLVCEIKCTLPHRWEHVSYLTWHTCPVLCLASLQLAAPCDDPTADQSSASSSPGSLLISGATDGSVALWHIQHTVRTGSSGQGVLGLEAQHMLCLPDVHQSGVNTACMAFVEDSAGYMSVCIPNFPYYGVPG
jgi:hypothetical protein